jgi:hypothetical protein
VKRLPKMWRKKNKAGRYVGNWLAKVSGDTVNLGTKDAELARKHLREALEGRREFVDEIDAAAAALGDLAPAPAAAQSVQDPPAGAQAAQPAAAPAASAPFAASGPASPATPAALPPIPPVDPQDFADTAAAAGEAAEAAASAAPGGGGGPEAPPDVPPDVLDGFLRNGAAMIVDMQLGLQAALIRRYTGRKAGPIPPESAARGMAAEAWVAQLKIWFPADTMLPPWAMALLIPAMAIPVQVATSTEIPEDEKDPAEAAAAS